MRTSALVGTALDWAVAQCEGWTYRYDFKYGHMYFPPKLYEGETTRWEDSPPKYSVNWKECGPIIEREKIETRWVILDANGKGYWQAANLFTDTYGYFGSTPLIAAMRCYVASKLGDKVEVPKELQQ